MALLGYLAGAGLAVVREQLGMVSNIVLGVLVAAVLVPWLRSHVWRRQSRL
ncbi:MAG: hypothetical protein WCF33_07215 [Pseudonocardiaceae bacterium]